MLEDQDLKTGAEWLESLMGADYLVYEGLKINKDQQVSHF